MSYVLCLYRGRSLTSLRVKKRKVICWVRNSPQANARPRSLPPSFCSTHVYHSARHKLTHTEQSCVRSYECLSYSINSPPFTEPGGSVSCSQKFSTGPYSDQADQVKFIYTHRSFKWTLLSMFFAKRKVLFFSLCVLHMPPSSSSLFRYL
jgi:hypothetical protein